jgi:hypothetical protein
MFKNIIFVPKYHRHKLLDHTPKYDFDIQMVPGSILTDATCTENRTTVKCLSVY